MKQIIVKDLPLVIASMDFEFEPVNYKLLPFTFKVIHKKTRQNYTTRRGLKFQV